MSFWRLQQILCQPSLTAAAAAAAAALSLVEAKDFLAAAVSAQLPAIK